MYCNPFIIGPVAHRNGSLSMYINFLGYMIATCTQCSNLIGVGWVGIGMPHGGSLGVVVAGVMTVQDRRLRAGGPT